MWKIKKSKLHGSGLFATQNIKKGSYIIQYKGEKISRNEGNKRSGERIKKFINTHKGTVYIFELNNKFDIDGAFSYNSARYINHSCDPNCEIEIKKDEIWIKSVKAIKKGSELTYDYGFSFDKDDYRDHQCKCGSKICIGYIISSDEWIKYKKHVEKLIKKRNK